MDFLKKEHISFGAKSYKEFILAGDVGGTNTALGIFGVKNKSPEMLVSFRFKSKELKSLNEAIKEALIDSKKEHGIKIAKACFGVAGVLSNDKSKAKITNLPWIIDKNSISKRTGIKKILLMNDFEAIGYGINLLGKKDIITVKNAKKATEAPILIIGAGTGLGKTVLLYDKNLKLYQPMPSEAGHSDFAAQTREEIELINFISKHSKRNVSYEEVLSGKGLHNIYLFLRKSKKFKPTKCTKEIDRSKNKPELISKYRKIDRTCRATFEIFSGIYAKFARNFALDSLAFGGVYIAGGIAPRNKNIFGSRFVRIFEQNHKLSHVLKKIPIYLIMNYDAGLLGAAFAAMEFL